MSKIIAAAIKYGQLVASLPRPNRHNDIIRAWYFRTGTPTGGNDIQGFIDNEGRFLTREEALVVAKANNQILEKYGNLDMLFSEDMW